MGNATIWERLEQSQLMTAAKVAEMSEEFQRQQPPTARIDDLAVADWLVGAQKVTPYQATVLKAGHAGPFFYGDYRVDERHRDAPRQGTFQAFHLPSNFQVLLKFVASDTTDNQWRTLASRVKQLSQIKHPNLGAVYEPVDLTQFRFAVLEDLPGESLTKFLAKKKKLSTKRACLAMLQVARAITKLHEAGIAHGELRPDMVLVDESGDCRVFLDPLTVPRSLYDTSGDNPAAVLNRARYLPPEMAEQGRLPDLLADVYAMGCIFYEMLAGSPPFDADEVVGLMQHHAATPIESLKPHNVPAQLEKLISFMMAKSPDVRHQSAAVVAAQLEALLTAAKANPAQPPVSERPQETKYRQWIVQKAQSLPSPEAKAVPVAPAITVAPVASTGTEVVPTANEPASESPVAAAIAPSDSFVKTDPADDRITRARTKSRKLNLPLLIGGAAIILIAVAVGGFVAMQSGGNSDVADNGNDDSDNEGTDGDGTDGGSNRTISNASYEQQVIADDGVQLWETPTLGAPIELDYVPLAPRVLVAARFANLLGSDDGQMWLRSLGPNLRGGLDAWSAILGVELEQIDQALIGFHDSPGNAPRATFRIKLTEPISLQSLQTAWGGEASTESGGRGRVWWIGGNGYSYLANRCTDTGEEAAMGELTNQFFVGNDEDIQTIVDTDGAPPIVRQELGQLLRYSDRDRHLSVFALPNTLFNDEGRRLFGEYADLVVEPLELLIGDAVGAAMLSAHLDEDFYLEVMLKGTLDVEPDQLSDSLKERIDTLGSQFSGFVFALSSNPYWDKVRMRFANWMSLVSKNTRCGVENRVVVANCWLPKPAAHNLTLATELALASSGVGGTVTTVEPMSTNEPPPQNLAELLERKIDLEIPRNDLVLILDELKTTVNDAFPSMPFEFDVRLMGNDLRLQGITQNQSVNDFNMNDSPIHAILTGLLLKAYTAPGVEGPTDPNWMLVWVAAPDPEDPDKTIVMVTTRVAADAAGYELPEAFRPENEDEE